MPLKLNVGVSKKCGMPGFSSIGALCQIEVDLDSGLLNDLDAFHAQARGAFIAAQQAVNDELSRLQAQGPPPIAAHPAPADGHDRQDSRGDGSGHRNGFGSRARAATVPTEGYPGRTGKAATAKQLKALHAIARAQHADLEGLIRDDHGIDRPEDLTLAQASALIDKLKAIAAS